MMCVVGCLTSCLESGSFYTGAMHPSHPEALLRPVGPRTSRGALAHGPEQRPPPEKSKRRLTSNRGCCNHVIVAELPNVFI